MGGEHDVLSPQLGVRTFQPGDQVRRSDRRALGGHRRLEAEGQGEAGHRLGGVGQGGELCEAVAGAFEEALALLGIEAGGEEPVRGLAQALVRQVHAWLTGQELSPRPRDLDLLGRHQRDQPHRPPFAEELGALVPVGGFRGSGEVARAAGDHHGDLALQVHALEVVVAQRRQVQAVADEHQRRIHPRRTGPPARADQQVFADLEHRGLARRVGQDGGGPALVHRPGPGTRPTGGNRRPGPRAQAPPP